jgi:low temperature requirement protein LtrA
VVFFMALTLLGEPLLRRHSVLASLRSVYLPLALAQPLLITVGFGATLWLLRNRVFTGYLVGRRHVVAAAFGVVVLGVISVFAQGAHLAFIISASVAAGAVAGLALVAAGRGQPLV